MGNGISVDVLTDGRILYVDWIPQDNLQWVSDSVGIKLAMLKNVNDVGCNTGVIVGMYKPSS